MSYLTGKGPIQKCERCKFTVNSLQLNQCETCERYCCHSCMSELYFTLGHCVCIDCESREGDIKCTKSQSPVLTATS